MLSVLVGSELPLTPATLAAPSNLPSFSTAALIQFLTSSSFRTSKVEPTNLPDKLSPTINDQRKKGSHFLAASSNPLAFRSLPCTTAASPTKIRVNARPIPLAAPVTVMTLPLNDMFLEFAVPSWMFILNDCLADDRRIF
jgi:hypothetical protein